jgi:hypothetical protein
MRENFQKVLEKILLPHFPVIKRVLVVELGPLLHVYYTLKRYPTNTEGYEISKETQTLFEMLGADKEMSFTLAFKIDLRAT